MLWLGDRVFGDRSRETKKVEKGKDELVIDRRAKTTRRSALQLKMQTRCVRKERLKKKNNRRKPESRLQEFRAKARLPGENRTTTPKTYKKHKELGKPTLNARRKAGLSPWR